MSDARLAGELSEAWSELRPALDALVKSALGERFALELVRVWPTESVQLEFALLDTSTGVGTPPPAEELPAVARRLAAAVRAFLRDSSIVASAYADWDLGARTVSAGGGPAAAGGDWDRVAPVLGAIATGVGVLGFVTFVGGAVEFSHLAAAGLPAETALAVVPTQNLVVIGAKTLVPALGAAGIATVALLFWYVYTFRVGIGAKRAKTPLRLAYTVPSLVVLSELFFFLFVHRGDRGVGEWLVFLALAGLTALVAYMVALATEKLVWLALVMFLSIGVSVTVVTVVSAANSKRVRPAAVVRTNDKAMIGFFIAETADRVYLGRISLNKDKDGLNASRSRIIELRNSQVTDLSIGPPLDPAPAVDRAKELAAELCREQIPRDQRTGGAAVAATASGDKGERTGDLGKAEDKGSDSAPKLLCWSAEAGREQGP